MRCVADIGQLFHRSRKRVQELGEVFTPIKHAEDMLDLLYAYWIRATSHWLFCLLDNG